MVVFYTNNFMRCSECVIDRVGAILAGCGRHSDNPNFRTCCNGRVYFVRENRECCGNRP